MNIEQVIEWAESVPMDELYNELRRLTGLSDLKFTSKVVNRNNSIRILFESQDLIDKVGFLKLMFKEIKITQFNSEVVYKTAEDDTEYLLFWGTVDFSYTHPSGGSNGYTFLTFWYDDIHGWRFESYKGI